MRRMDTTYRLTKINGKFVSVAVCAVFSMSSQAAFSADLSTGTAGGGEGYAGTTLTVSADLTRNIDFDLTTGQTLKVDATAGNVTLTGTALPKTAVNIGSATVELSTAVGNTATISGNVSQAAVGGSSGTIGVKISGATAAATGNAALGAVANVQTIQFASNGTLTITGAATVAGAVTNTTGTTGKGTLVLNGGGTITGAVGSSTAALAALQAGAGATASFAATSAPVYATTTTINGTNAVTFSGGLSGTTLAFGGTDGTAKIGGGYNLAAAVTNNDNTGTVQFLGATTVSTQLGSSNSAGLKSITFDTGAVSIGGAMHTKNAANSINIGASSAATATYTASAAFSGRMTLNNNSTLDLSSFTVTGETANNKSDLITTSGSTIKTKLISDAANSSGKMTLDGTNTVIAAGTKVYVDVNGLTITSGRQFKIIDNTNGTSVATLTASDITDSSAVLSFTQVANTQDLILEAVRSSGGYATAAGISTSDVSANAGTALNSLAGTATGSVSTLITYLDGLSATTLAAEVKKLAPSNGAATSQAAMGATSGALGAVATRMAAVRGDTQLADASGETGVAAGEAGKSKAFWAKGFGARAKQNQADSFDGYKARTYGLALGGDTELGNGLQVGGAYSYADTKVDVQDVHTGDDTHVKSHQFTVYGTKEMGAAYLEGMVAYGRHNYDTRRAVPQSLVAAGSFSATQWTGKIGGGYRMKSGPATITPLASLTFSNLDRDAYTETGGGGANLSYDAQKTNSLKSGLGVRVVGTEGNVKPEVHAIWNHEFGDRRVDTTSSFAGGTAFTTTGQEIKRDSWNLGGGLTFQASKAASVNVSYDYEGRSGFSSHTGQVTGRWEF